MPRVKKLKKPGRFVKHQAQILTKSITDRIDIGRFEGFALVA
jgi:hypothetical protein